MAAGSYDEMAEGRWRMAEPEAAAIKKFRRRLRAADGEVGGE